MNGFNNEYQFVLALNNKKVKELNPLLKELIYDIFYNIEEDMTIKSWRNHFKQKNDIMIKIENHIKGISIKMGSRNSVHVESLEEFTKFLKSNKIPDKIIKIYREFHYGNELVNNKIERLNSKEYREKHQKEIDTLNKYINKDKIIYNAVKRFILYGNNSIYPIDAIVYGTPKDFIYIKPNEIIQLNIASKEKEKTSPHIGNLYIQPLGRCINRNPKYENARKYIQVKWYSLFDDIIEIMNNKNK